MQTIKLNNRCSAITAAALTAIALIASQAPATAQETSDRSPEVEAQKPLAQSDSYNGETSDRTPDKNKKTNQEMRQETSDRTPGKATKTPLPQVDGVNGETSDRTPGNG